MDDLGLPLFRKPPYPHVQYRSYPRCFPWNLQEQSAEKDRQLAAAAAAAAAAAEAAEEAKRKAEEDFKSELEDLRTHPHFGWLTLGFVIQNN